MQLQNGTSQERAEEIGTWLPHEIHETFTEGKLFKDTSVLSRIPPKPAAECLVYFISTKARAFPVKIGRTNNYKAMARLSQLQVGCPYTLEFFVAVPGSAEYELELHEQFARDALRGEWFVRTPELIRLIDSLQRDNPAWRTLLRAPQPGIVAT